MNWDEIEDLAMLFTGAYNPNSQTQNETDDEKKVTEYGTTYGYFTEWWFNYGWSVGGDCLQDLTDMGEWNFSLLDPNPNYIVKEGKTFVGRTGTIYKEGETLEFVDKMNLSDGEIPVANNDGDYYHADGSKVGIWTEIQKEMAKGEDSALAELASTEEAFQRYLKLGAARSADIDGDRGLNVSPNPNTITVRGSANWFFSGELAMVTQTSGYMAAISEQAQKRGFEWDLAPLTVYKQYTNPSDPQDDINLPGPGTDRTLNKQSSKIGDAYTTVRKYAWSIADLPSGSTIASLHADLRALITDGAKDYVAYLTTAYERELQSRQTFKL